MKNAFSEYFSFTSLKFSSECQMNDGNTILAHGVALISASGKWNFCHKGFQNDLFKG